jgi:hypothetical protein
MRSIALVIFILIGIGLYFVNPLYAAAWALGCGCGHLTWKARNLFNRVKGFFS